MSSSEESINQRVSELITRFTNGKQRRFADLIGIGSGALGDIVGQRKSKPGYDITVKILRALPELRAEWLMLGEGVMLKSEELPKNNFVYEAAPAAPTEPRAYVLQEGENRGAPLYNLPTAASYLGQGGSQERVEPDGIITMPSWLLRSGDYAVFPVIGDSMEPTFYAKDYVICRFLAPAEWQYFTKGNVAVIVTDRNGLQLKRLTFRTEGGVKEVRCVSDNRQHPSYDIELSEVLEIWRFEWRITRNATNVTESFTDRITKLEEGQDDLRRLVESMMDVKELRRLESLRNPMAQD